jgi:tRNA(Ile2) C34 agmatinyltransferase TiaS
MSNLLTIINILSILKIFIGHLFDKEEEDMGKLKTCPVCGKEMAANAKTCPSCGARNQKPLYKKWWFWLVLIVLIGAVGSAMGGGEEAEKPQTPAASSQSSADAPAASSQSSADAPESVSYTAYTVDQLMNDLDANALKAQETYLEQDVELTGTLSVIDSSGKYISLRPANDAYAIIGVQCYLNTEEQRQQVMELEVGDSLTVRGRITAVGEVMGYTLELDELIP